MRRIAYKTDCFQCTLFTAKKFNQRLQEMLDRYAAEGWLLHSWKIIHTDTMCELVFYREESL